MKVIYNSRLISDENLSLDIHNRAFCYGDGLFETIVTGPDRLNLIDFHLDRLRRGCEVLDLNFPKLDHKKVTEWIKQLSRENALGAEVRTRLQVWRNPGGLYSPELESSSFLISSGSNDYPFYRKAHSIGFAESATIVKSPISFAKTMSALPYVLAGMEKEKRKVDELIICNSQGFICESISSNIFWIKDGLIYTPALESGCIDGVMRRYIKDNCEILEVLEPVSTLEDAESIFLSNASGLVWVESLEEDQRLKNPLPFLTLIVKPLPQP